MNRFLIKVSGCNDVDYVNLLCVSKIGRADNGRTKAKLWMQDGHDFTIDSPSYSELLAMLADFVIASK